MTPDTGFAAPLTIARSELILGGQRSGKSRRAERLAQQWLAAAPEHQAVFIATATGRDAEMRARIARHQQDRAERLPGMHTVEEAVAIAAALTAHSTAQTLVVVDCLTLWLTHVMMPAPTSKATGWGDPDDARFATNAAPVSPDALEALEAGYPQAEAQRLLSALASARGPVILVGNEIGLGVIPLGRETRAFVDALGRLNQGLAQAVERVTFMAAGLPLTLKAPA